MIVTGTDEVLKICQKDGKGEIYMLYMFLSHAGPHESTCAHFHIRSCTRHSRQISKIYFIELAISNEMLESLIKVTHSS